MPGSMAADADRRCQIAEFGSQSLSWAISWHSVICRQVIDNRLGVGRSDRRAKRIDHLGHFGFPSGGIEKSRVHLHIIETVAGAAIGLDLVEAGRRVEADRLLDGG